MSGIDWSKAPEGATHYWPYNGCFFEKDGDAFYVAGKKAWGKVYTTRSFEAELIERPSPAWNGEGLPPVGTMCEVELASGTEASDRPHGWLEGEILAHYSPCEDGDMVAVVAVFCSGGRMVYQRAEGCFRPRRIPEQIAAEERAAAFHAAICDVEERVAKWNTNIDCTAAIKATVDIMIELGYRK